MILKWPADYTYDLAKRIGCYQMAFVSISEV